MRNLKKAANLVSIKNYGKSNKEQIVKTKVLDEIEKDLSNLGWTTNFDYLNYSMFTLGSHPSEKTSLNIIAPLLSKEYMHINTVTKGKKLLGSFMDIGRPEWTEINAEYKDEDVTDVLPMSMFLLSVPYPVDFLSDLKESHVLDIEELDSEKKPHLVFNCSSIHSSLTIHTVTSNFEPLSIDKFIGQDPRTPDLWYEIGNKYTGMEMEGMSVEWKLAIRELLNVYGINEEFLIALENMVIELHDTQKSETEKKLISWIQNL